MARARFVAAAALVLPFLLGAPAPPGRFHLVINNTSLSLTCSFKSAGAWAPWFQVLPGENWRHFADVTDEGAADEGAVDFQCRPPVRQLRYTLEPGARYSLLRNASGGIDLVEVTTRRRRPDAPH